MPEPRQESPAETFGPNAGLVDEMWDRYRTDPASVSESWRDFFDDYGAVPAPVAPHAGNGRVAGQPLRGASARLAENMEASLSVPTATSARVVAARLLEVNRGIMNGHLGRIGAGRVSFTHLIGFAVARAAGEMAAMRRVWSPIEGKPAVVIHDHVNLGLAVDVERSDGTRALLVPCLRNADTLDFAAFRARYEELVRDVRGARLAADDLAGVNLTLTNPGTIGTVHSVPRLMPGQSAIVGVGALGYPAEFQGADPRQLAGLGVSKVVTITSTYDHRVIQGAESGLFLARIEALLLGADRFYDEAFRAVGVPYEAVRWNPHVSAEEDTRHQPVKQVHVQTLINTYRVRGHLIADLDPLAAKEPRTHPELDPATHGLSIWDLEREFFTDGVAGRDVMKLADLLGVLRDAYCRRIGIEYMHIQEPEQKQWVQERVEGVASSFERAEQLHILDRLNAAEAFERFLHTKFVGHKRFGLEGAESLIPLVDALLTLAVDAGCREAVLGMAHRGRLNVLANVVGKPLSRIFREFEGNIDPATIQGSGDVKYHLGASGTFATADGRTLAVTLASNPSHVEAVDPVVEGMVRGRQDLARAEAAVGDPTTGSLSGGVLPLVIHGDAAFAGQGVVAETFNLSALPGYRVGGTIHLVVNNQLGFTTDPTEARSSQYPTDIAKMVQAPIFHVNGDDPESCVRVARLAFAFRRRFAKDVVIDMVCYRRHGHNEADDPSITQPQMYKRIEGRRSVRKLYTEVLVRRGDITTEDAEAALDDFLARMQAAFEQTRDSSPPSPEPPAPPPLVAVPAVDTGVARGRLDAVATTGQAPPEGFTVHPRVVRVLEARRQAYEQGQVDWAMAEALALGSILTEGTDVRLTGQDTRRGTFSQRHAVVVDYETGQRWTPLSHVAEGQGRFWVYDSLLSEYAALGFEYGYSTAHPAALVIWEAQFGDFANGAQIVIDQFIASAETKWSQSSGIVMLLPHGFEGQGPEHSSARIERFLTLCAGDNLAVVNATTSAQYFHVLRRQVHGPRRRPLILFTPKSLLRAASARSTVSELEKGRFREVLDDTSTPDPSVVTRVILASGKVAHDAMARRDELGYPAAIVRVEQLYPWPALRLLDTVARYSQATEVVWLQEEPANMGAWPFVRARLESLLGAGITLRRVSRAESASPATGSHTVHDREQAELLAATFD